MKPYWTAEEVAVETGVDVKIVQALLRKAEVDFFMKDEIGECWFGERLGRVMDAMRENSGLAKSGELSETERIEFEADRKIRQAGLSLISDK